MPRTLAPVSSFSTSARIVARPPSWAWPKPSLAATFRYELIDALAESQDYTILLMKKRYAQPLDKRTLTGGTVEEFKRFLEENTGKTFRRVK